MPSERVQRQIERLLDEADDASLNNDWLTVKARAEAALTFDPGNADATAYLEAANRGTSNSKPSGVPDETQPSATSSHDATPTSFANGRYEVKRLLGEVGKKNVYLAHDTTLDRYVEFGLIMA